MLLKTAIGLIQPASGQVHLCGNNITGREEDEIFLLRRRVGFLFQEGGFVRLDDGRRECVISTDEWR